MLYVYGMFTHGFYFISVFYIFSFLAGVGGWGRQFFMITSNLALYTSLALYHAH